ncbi:MAG: hypothetical protein GY862_27110 [Gammaproteobacteria bacterium]|nr:hypothetical protein [Gammaproteobacteria bacterium]MCP5013867.1 hypothetical protein [Ketobacter sp.]
MNKANANKAQKIYDEYGKDLADFTKAEKLELVRRVRAEVSAWLRQDIDLQAVSESGEYPSLVTRLLQGDAIYFAQQLEPIIVDCWISVLAEYVEIDEAGGDDWQADVIADDNKERAAACNEINGRPYAA